MFVKSWRFAATDEGSGVLYTKYKLDGNDWTTYTDSFLVTVDGNHTVLFYSVDRNGNTEEQQTRMFTVRQHSLLMLTILGGKGVPVIIENKGLLPVNKIPWHINLSGGIILKGTTKNGIIPQLLPGQQKTLTSSIIGFGKTLITATVGEASISANGFVFLIFVIGVQ